MADAIFLAKWLNPGDRQHLGRVRASDKVAGADAYATEFKQPLTVVWTGIVTGPERW